MLRDHHFLVKGTCVLTLETLAPYFNVLDVMCNGCTISPYKDLRHEWGGNLFAYKPFEGLPFVGPDMGFPYI